MVKNVIKKSANNWLNQVVANYILQGHNNTGKGLKSFRLEVKPDGNNWSAKVYAANYVNIIDKGVKPDRIAYYPNSGRKTSKAVQGLTRYFMSKGLPLKKAKGAAFATLKTQVTKKRGGKGQGLPTRGSKKYSRATGGRRKGFTKLSIRQRRENYKFTIQAIKPIFRYY